MRSISKFWLLIFAVAVLVRPAWAASFTATLDRDSITLGEQVTLSLKFEDVQPQNPPDLPNIDGLQIQYAGPFSLRSNNNGQVTFVFAYNYTVAPQHDGRFTIPAMTITFNGQRLTSQALTLTVAKADPVTAAAANSGNEVAFMKLSLPPGKLYVGQIVTAQLQIYLRDDVLEHGQPQFNGIPMEGFSMNKNTGGNAVQTQIGNHAYAVIPITLALNVTKSGTLTLGPFNAGMVVLVGSPNNPLQAFFNQGERRQISLVTETLHPESLPLPTQQRPTNFNGAIGDFTMSTSIGPTNLAVGDPVTIHVQISGHGTIDSVMLPDQSNLAGFKVFPPTSKIELDGQLGLDGTKTFEKIVTPQNADVHELPAFSFSFFNPDDGRYHTLTQAAVPLVVKATGATPLPTIAAAKNYAADNSQSPADIAPIKNDLGRLTAASAPLIESPKFLVLQSVPVLAFLAALIWRKRTDSLANNPRLRRKIYVAQLVQTGLSDLKKSAAANNPDEFFATLFRLLQEQLGERLDCPASAITENVIEEHPVLRGAAATTRSGLHEIFQLCNQARYAPVRGVSELNSVAQQFEKVIGELQNLKV